MTPGAGLRHANQPARRELASGTSLCQANGNLHAAWSFYERAKAEAQNEEARQVLADKP